MILCICMQVVGQWLHMPVAPSMHEAPSLARTSSSQVNLPTRMVYCWRSSHLSLAGAMPAEICTAAASPSCSPSCRRAGLLPADSDYRMFSYKHYGSLPGLDIAFLLDGAAYHTDRDTVDRLRPGTLQVRCWASRFDLFPTQSGTQPHVYGTKAPTHRLLRRNARMAQAMGENVLGAVPELARTLARHEVKPEAEYNANAVYFDLFGLYMVRTELGSKASICA